MKPLYLSLSKDFNKSLFLFSIIWTYIYPMRCAVCQGSCKLQHINQRLRYADMHECLKEKEFANCVTKEWNLKNALHCSVFYEIRGRCHYLLKQGFGPLCKVMENEDQRCLGILQLMLHKWTLDQDITKTIAQTTAIVMHVGPAPWNTISCRLDIVIFYQALYIYVDQLLVHRSLWPFEQVNLTSHFIFISLLFVSA